MSAGPKYVSQTDYWYLPIYWHISSVLAHPHWLPVSFHTWFKFLVITYKALNNFGLQYLAEHVSHKIATHPTCSSQPFILRTWTPKEAKRSSTRSWAFLIVAPSLWNKLSTEVHEVPSLSVSRKLSKMELYKVAFYWCWTLDVQLGCNL